MMSKAQHSIKILAWDLSLSCGLVLKSDVPKPPPTVSHLAKWITLDVKKKTFFQNQ